MTNRRAHFVPWRSAGNLTETDIDSDEVVRETGWVFNNKTGDALTLESFVKTGEAEAKRYMRQFGFTPEQLAASTLLEIGSGIGRMTSEFTQSCAKVIAADVDAAFLERCRETVSTQIACKLSTSPTARRCSWPTTQSTLRFRTSHCNTVITTTRCT